MRSPVAPSRSRALNARPVNPRGDFVLYWMIAARRTRWNFALQHAVNLCAELKAPLLILEAMKMEHTIAAPHDGVIAEIATEGAQITDGTVLVRFEE